MGDVLVLCYHTVGPWTHPMSVDPMALRQQVEGLLERGYRSVTFSEIGTLPEHGRYVVPTFDDGFRGTYDEALPVLRELGAIATVFPATSFVTDRTPLQWPGFAASGELAGEAIMPLSWAQLRELADAGWEVGSHTQSHTRLTRIDDDALGRELAESRAIAEAELGRPCRSIAYPFGDVDARVILAAKTAGYRFGATLEWRTPSTVDLVWPRVGVYRDDTPVRFRLKVAHAMHGRVGNRLVQAHRRARRRLGLAPDQVSS